VVRCLVEIEHVEDTGYLVEIVLSLAEALFQFDAVQNQRDLYPFGVPVRAIRRGGDVQLVNVLLDNISTYTDKPSERCYSRCPHSVFDAAMKFWLVVQYGSYFRYI